ncbi:MAG: glycosyltransferase family 1 protein [Acidobacteriia bacterium]|nr:glycosyltransferase family 1 protein [Terriglobia bacterium]
MIAANSRSDSNPPTYPDPSPAVSPPIRLLAVCTVDVMAWKLLRPWFRALADAGYEVHIACSRENWFDHLAADGFHMHEVRLRRRVNPFVHIAPLWELFRLIRRERFVLVNTHSPVAAAVGRVAAWLARAPVIISTVHGFYFHDGMPWWKRKMFVTMEWLLGGMTTDFMFVSDEDRTTAVREGIARDPERATTIYNGVDLTAYPDKRSPSRLAVNKGFRQQLNIPEAARVVGIVGRIVREKGFVEFAEMAQRIAATHPNVYFLVVGDALATDRDGMVPELKSFVESAGLNTKFRFTGFTDKVAEHLQVMDIFVLPSYREGFPRSVLEAMSCELPVVATRIRGCREAVVQGATGLLVPPRDAAALTDAVGQLLDQPELMHQMGAAGRERVVHLFEQGLVQARFKAIVARALRTIGMGTPIPPASL